MPIGSRIMAISQWVSVIRNGSWLIGILFLAVSAALGFILPSEVGTWVKVTFLAAIIFSLLAGILIGGYIFQKISHNRDTPLGYRVISETYDYKFDDSDPRRQSQLLTRVVEARRPSVAMIEYRYYWSGQGERPTISIVKGSGDILHNTSWAQSHYTVFYVRLRRPIEKGDRREITLKFSMNDTGGQFRPYLKKTVSEHIGKLRLIVRFPKTLVPSNEQISSYKSAVASEKSRSTFKCNWDEVTRVAHLEVRSPKKNDVYTIEWEWDYMSFVDLENSHGKEER